MSGLASADLRGYMGRLDLTKQRMLHQITATYRDLIETVFTDIVEHTPQFTGNLAYGWEIVTNSHPAEGHTLLSDSARATLLHQAYVGDLEPYHRGSEPTVQEVLERELPKLAGIRWNSIVKIVNHINYAEGVDKGEGPDGREIRPENLYYGQVFMTSYAAIKYSRMKNLIKVTT